MYLKKLIHGLTALLLAPLSFSAWDDINMTPGANAIAQEIFGLHMTVFWICVAIGAAVLGFMVFLILKYRKKEGVEPADFDDNPKLELTWTILFAVILVGLSLIHI